VVFTFFFLLEEILKSVEWGFIVASGFAAYLLLLVISYLLLSHPDVDPLWRGILLTLSLVALIAPGYVIIKAMWRILSSMPVMLLLAYTNSFCRASRATGAPVSC
jgi:hypothetical protein